MNATGLWMLWQDILAPFAARFTQPGFHRFVEWLTGLALNVEEHTITQSLVGLDLTRDWKALERFAEYGAWDSDEVERATTLLLQDAPGRLWHGFYVSAVDDTKVHRTSKEVWGTNTFHEYTARCPNRASTVRAHNWVVLGALLENPNQPAWFVPLAGRLYFRKSQLPAEEVFRTKCQLLVEMARKQAEFVGGKHLLTFDGAFAVRSVVRPLVDPDDGSPRIHFITRLRHDARLFRNPDAERRPGQRGPGRKWGPALPPPRQGGRWPGPWQKGQAFLYGRVRRVSYKEVVCLWGVLGWAVPVKAVVADVEGYRQRFTIVSSKVTLGGLDILTLFCARFRQEDGFRDLKQRLGWEECRAWTKLPIVRTTQALFVVFVALRVVQWRLEAAAVTDWWMHPPWNPHKVRPSVLDLGRLFRRYSSEMKAHLACWLEKGQNNAA
jgi:hypothetical protein